MVHATERAPAVATETDPDNAVTAPAANSGSDLGLFVGQLLRRPNKIVALAPSSVGLSEKMVERLGPDTGSVIELGTGTGKITDFILGRGIAEENMALVEINSTFVDVLEAKYPKAQVVQRSATEIEEIEIDNVGAVVSGLPLLSMPTSVQREIVGGAFRKLRPGGIFVQFTYGYRPPVDREVRDALGLDWNRSAKVWLNLPPARAYTFWQKS